MNKLVRRNKLGRFKTKSQKDTLDSYNKYAKKFFGNLSLPRNLKKPIPDFPYIYKWFRCDTGKIFYLGAGVNKRAWTLSRRNNLTINVVKKVGKKGVKIIIVKMKSWEAALKKEEELIKKYGRRDNKTGILTNMTDGGQGATGRPMNEYTKKIISKHNKKRIYSDEQKLNLSKKMKIIKANVSQETREKLRQKFIGKPRPKWMGPMLLENMRKGRSKVLKWNKSSDGKKHMGKIVELAKIWHKSDEGKKWHSKMSKETWKNKKTTKKICVNCKKNYQTYFPTRSKYCSNNCKSLYRNKK